MIGGHWVGTGLKYSFMNVNYVFFHGKWFFLVLPGLNYNVFGWFNQCNSFCRMAVG